MLSTIKSVFFNNGWSIAVTAIGLFYFGNEAYHAYDKWQLKREYEKQAEFEREVSERVEKQKGNSASRIVTDKQNESKINEDDFYIDPALVR